jgi:cytochrome c oxidase assembly protein subunit 11
VLKLSNNPAVNTATRLVAVAVMMFAFVFVVMVPLYNVLCDALGINGKTDGRAYTSVQAGIDESRLVTVQFVATNNEGMPWEFGPSVAVMQVHPGAVNDTTFFAHNTLGKDMVAQAIPSISPARAVQYFHKTECFCFNQQPLAAGAATRMPLQYIVDRDLPADIHTITLSYTIFDVTDMAKSAVATR